MFREIKRMIFLYKNYKVQKNQNRLVECGLLLKERSCQGKSEGKEDKGREGYRKNKAEIEVSDISVLQENCKMH